MVSELDLIREIEKIEAVAESTPDPEFRYGRVFILHDRNVRPMLSALGIVFEYIEQLDSSYQEDVTGYLDAVSRVKSALLQAQNKQQLT